MKLFRRLSTLMILFTSFYVSQQAFAIERSCNAYFGMDIVQVDGNRVQSRTLTFGNFFTRRGCGQTVPDRCRRRARDSAHSCMRDHWTHVRDMAAPKSCRGQDVRNYQVRGSLHNEVEKQACEYARAWINPNVNQVVVNVRAVSEGDSGCAMQSDLGQMYSISCLNTSAPQMQSPPPVQTPPNNSPSQPSGRYLLQPGSYTASTFQQNWARCGSQWETVDQQGTRRLDCRNSGYSFLFFKPNGVVYEQQGHRYVVCESGQTGNVSCQLR
jgi:hypothetical protein